MSPLPEKVLSHLKEVVSRPMEPKAKLLYFALVIDSGGETMSDIPEQKYQDITGLHNDHDFMVTLCSLAEDYNLIDVCEDGDLETYIQFRHI